jgi:hypothetical protein
LPSRAPLRSTSPCSTSTSTAARASRSPTPCARGLPFLFATGYGGRIVPAPYRDTPILQKPFSLEELKGALQRAGL